jgi:nucleotide-binding universal stress UspA family protein
MSSSNILVPLDGSALSEAALPYAVAVAKAKKAALQLLTVIDIDTGSFFAGRAKEEIDFVLRVQSDTSNYLSSKRTQLSKEGVAATSAVLTGRAADEILHEAEQIDASMVVMATHGRGGLERWALGSVADKVMRLSERPVLLVRPADAGAAARPVKLNRILVPLDGSALAESAVAPAAEIASATGASITLLRVEPWLSTQWWAAEGLYVPDLSQLEAEAEAAAKDYLTRARAQIPEEVTTEIILLRGTVAGVLEEFSARDEIDLVIMSTHGRGGVRRFVLGSEADRLVRSGAPTLLIHPPATENDEPRERTEAASVAG